MPTNVKPGVKDIKAMVEVLEGEYADAKEAAKAVLEAAFEIYEGKSKWMILGALVKDPTGRTDPITAERVCFGPYGTETQARAAQAQLFYSTATGEEFVRWLLPMNHGTPAAWFRKRKQAREAAEEAVGDAEFTRAVPPHHQGTPERQAASQAAADARITSNKQAAWERAKALRAYQQELDPEVPRQREENAA